MTHSQVAQGIHHSVAYGWHSTRVTQFPYALRSQRVSRGWSFLRFHHQLRHIFCDGHSIVHEAASQGLSFRRVEYALSHSLAYPLHQCAMNLPFHQLGVDNSSAVVDSNAAQQLEQGVRFFLGGPAAGIEDGLIEMNRRAEG